MELELKEYFAIIKKRLWMIATIVLVSCIVTGAVSYFYIQPVYSASTKLIVNGATPVKDLNYFSSDAIRSQILMINTYKEIIKSPAIMDKVAEKYPDLGLTSEQLIRKISVSSVSDTQVITISTEDHSQARAVSIVNAVAEVFKEITPTFMKIDNIMILSEAKTQEKPVPVKPKKEINLAISFVVALMAGIGLAFLLEYLDDTVKSEADVQELLQLPVLVTIHKMSKDEFKKTRTDNPNAQVGETRYASIGQ